MLFPCSSRKVSLCVPSLITLYFMPLYLCRDVCRWIMAALCYTKTRQSYRLKTGSLCSKSFHRTLSNWLHMSGTVSICVDNCLMCTEVTSSCICGIRLNCVCLSTWKACCQVCFSPQTFSSCLIVHMVHVHQHLQLYIDLIWILWDDIWYCQWFWLGLTFNMKIKLLLEYGKNVWFVMICLNSQRRRFLNLLLCRPARLLLLSKRLLASQLNG